MRTLAPILALAALLAGCGDPPPTEGDSPAGAHARPLDRRRYGAEACGKP